MTVAFPYWAILRLSEREGGVPKGPENANGSPLVHSHRFAKVDRHVLRVRDISGYASAECMPPVVVTSNYLNLSYYWTTQTVNGRTNQVISEAGGHKINCGHNCEYRLGIDDSAAMILSGDSRDGGTAFTSSFLPPQRRGLSTKTRFPLQRFLRVYATTMRRDFAPFFQLAARHSRFFRRIVKGAGEILRTEPAEIAAVEIDKKGGVNIAGNAGVAYG
ncbi:hypothetical protein C8J57DRAFT_1231174 [Mycena rebaudengoi]|nr:hypothetical protein C8J57DRAFT_1231174 [Mycena rebaudengoi]